MVNFVLDSSELFFLLNQMGIKQLPGMESDQSTVPQEPEPAEILDQGLNQLEKRNLVRIRGDKVEIDEELHQLFKTMSDPQAIVRTLKETAEEEYHSWYYISGSSIVEFLPIESDRFRLATVADLQAVAEALRNLLPLVPEPDPVRYQAEVPEEDAEDIRSLIQGWEMVPALNIMEADGLEMAEAMDLFDDLADFQWWGRVDMMACQEGRVTTSRRVLAIQGQERSWVARQKTPGTSTIHIETAQAGELEAFVRQYWAEINS